jgi:peroxiredoxin Q/BCP
LNAVILGVSPDTPADQKKFHEKFSLPFDLLCDTDRAAAKAYDVWKEKNMYGKIVMGIERTTFIIAADGNIAKVFPKVKADGHAEKVLEALSA